MGILFNKLSEPVFLKESSNAETQLEQLKTLEPSLDDEGKKVIQQDITCLEYGIAGEKNIAFELKNSHIPMYVLHDVYMENGDLSAQIDYLVFTRKICFVIECKNLYGNITIDNNGRFIRTMYFGKHKVQEGLYSPITQNIRHLELLKKIQIEKNSGAIKKMFAASGFDLFYKSVVVLANPKTILNDRYATKEIKKQVIRADQLAKYIKDANNESKEFRSSDDEMHRWAQSFLDCSKDNETDYLEKYEKYRSSSSKSSEETEDASNKMNNKICPRCGGKLVQRKGKYGDFLGCTNFPKCRFTQKL